MRIAILTASKFFKEALRFLLHDRIHQMYVSESIDSLTREMNRKDYDYIIIDVDSVKFNIPDIDQKLSSLKSKRSRVVISSFNPEEDMSILHRAERIDFFIHRPLNALNVLKGFST